MRKKITAALTVLLATGISLTAAMPVYAGTVGFCNPGRTSNATQTTIYTEASYEFASGPYIDEVRASFRDTAPKVISGRSHVYVSLRESASRYARFGYYINFSGARKIYAEYSNNTGQEWYQEWSAGNVSQLNAPLDGSGETHKFTINRHGPGTGIEFLIDGQTLFNFWYAGIWEANHARVSVDTGNKASQWWGRNSARWYATDVEAISNQGANLSHNFGTPVNPEYGDDAVAFTDYPAFNETSFTVYDADC